MNKISAMPAIVASVFLVGFGCVSVQADAPPVVIKVTAKKYTFVPNKISLKKGVAYDLQFTTADKAHGFEAPDLNLRTSIKPGQPADLKFTPNKAGTFPFYCDVFCGPGHDDMSGSLVVSE